MSKKAAVKSPKFWDQLQKQFPGFVLGLVASALVGGTGLVVDHVKVERDEKAKREIERVKAETERAKVAEIEALIHHEAEYASLYSSGDKAFEVPYSDLYSPDAWIMDVQDPKSAARGTDKITRRLHNLPPIVADHQLLGTPQQLTESTAIAQTQTSLELKGEAEPPGHERWFFRKIDGHWKIQRFEYNLGPSDR